VIAVTALIVRVATRPARDARLVGQGLIGFESHVIVLTISSRWLISPRPKVAATLNQNI
jgi:multisubunit Na+/H+ antiporter MnhF subunit